MFKERMMFAPISTGIAVAALASGCVCAGGSEPVEVRIRSGFSHLAPNLFGMRRGRLSDLVGALGYDFDVARMDHSTDGSSIRFWNYSRTQVIIIAKGREPWLMKTPPGGILDDTNRVVAWYGPDRSRNVAFFPNGVKIAAPGFQIDPSGTFFCTGGPYADYHAGEQLVIKAAPLVVSAVSDPKKALVTSRLSGLADGMYLAGPKLYLFTRAERRAGVVGCEVFTVRGKELAHERSFEIRSPRSGCSSLMVTDFNPRTEQCLLFDDRSFPFARDATYLHDLKTGRTSPLPRAGWSFLDPKVFDRALERLSPRPPASQRQQPTRGPADGREGVWAH